MEQVQPKIKMELPKEVTDAILGKVLDTFDVANSKATKNKFPLYLTKKQACEYLNISNSTMNEWIALGDIPFKHIGKTYRFNRNELDKFMLTK